ncbi:MAG: TfoX/Sxy family DNA transformation protein [Boseongicola sp.]|nr:TfoX/Sxy family DNA transformation protein [Boseongicola sp.]
MTDPVSSIRNLGPASDVAFARAGITSADDLRALDPDEAYFRLISAGSKPHFIGYYAMVMGLQGRPWNDCRGKEKADLRKRFDAVKARRRDPAIDKDGLPSDLASALNAIGVINTKKN